MSNRRRPDGSPPPDPDAAGPDGNSRDRARSNRPANRTGPGRGPGRRPPARRPVQRRPTPRGTALLVRLKALPPFVLPILVFALLLLGLLGPTLLAVPALVVIAALLIWLASLSWPHVSPRGKVLRAVAVGFVVAAIATRIFGLIA